MPESRPESAPSPGLSAEQAAAPPSPPDLAAQLFPNPQLPPTDDIPTVISRAMPQANLSEGFFAGNLQGRRLAHFELLEAIGVGGMAAVLKARDTQLDRSVALKILPPDMAADRENVRRFHQEARAAARLDHENIARVFYCGEDQSLHFIAFEFVEGDNLRAIVDRKGRLPVADAVNYMLQLATGLAHAAARGVVHRDIKPSNIIITPTGRAKLVDMGLARSLGSQHDRGLTHSGVTLGTFDYISPEQALEPRDADVRSDIYSLGCTFYHALTGQPPVPEGTAAKKLNHHQNIAPTDPREINPEIPDEVTAILARMMAKDPRERYQRAEHLVQHLIQVAQKLGAAADTPEGVLFVDAPLPNPPRPRPLLLAGTAVGTLLVLLIVLGVFSNNGPTADEAFSNGSGGTVSVPPEGKGRAEASAQAPTGDPVRKKDEVTPPKRSQPFEAATARAAIDYLQTASDPEGAPRQAEAQLILTGDFDLGGEGRGDDGMALPSLRFRGHKLVVRSRDRDKPATIRLTDDGRSPLAPTLWALLTLDCDVVELRGVRLVVDARLADARLPDTVLACLSLGHGQDYTIENCEFIQVRPLDPSSAARLTAVVVDTSARNGNVKTPLLLKSCYFAGAERALLGPDKGPDDWSLTGVDRGGLEAIAVNGPVRLHALSCAFAPHNSLFALQGAGKDALEVKLDNCSALLSGDSSVFALKSGTYANLQAEHCLFSRPGTGSDAAARKQAVLIRQTDEPTGLATYHGSDNRYHRLDAFWLRADNPLETWTEFQTALGKNDDSFAQTDNPWKNDDPLKLLEHLDRKQLRDAFQVNTQLAELRERRDGRSTRLVGIDQPPATWGTSYDTGLAALERKTGTTVVRIVDPRVTESGQGKYPSLSQAILDARPGDEILIRHTGRLVERPIRLEKADIDITIRPEAGSHPILVLDEANTADREAALFRIHNGKVKLEGLEFQLSPHLDFASQSLAAVFGDGQCLFKDCVMTLDTGGKAVPLAVVRIDDAASIMKPARPGDRRAAVRFDDCFVRGDGDLVAVRSSRAFDLGAENLLAVLSGSLLNVDGNRDNLAPPAAGQAIHVELGHVTASLGGHVVRLQAGRDARGLLPIQADQVSDSLFASTSGKSLVHLDGPDATEDRLRTLLGWKGKHNAYANFTQMVDQQPRDTGAMPQFLWGQKEWKNNYERDAQFNPMRFMDAPMADDLPRALPTQFKLKVEGEPSGYGAEVEQLPKPASENTSSRSESS